MISMEDMMGDTLEELLLATMQVTVGAFLDR
jgi:hypothetical protein